MTMDNLRDVRAPGLPDIPYSAYCKVCWQNVYCLWIEKTDHGGVCPFGAAQISDCKQASDWERVRGEVRKHLRASTEPTGTVPSSRNALSGGEGDG